jgi:hypothetical protein
MRQLKVPQNAELYQHDGCDKHVSYSSHKYFLHIEYKGITFLHLDTVSTFYFSTINKLLQSTKHYLNNYICDVGSESVILKISRLLAN